MTYNPHELDEEVRQFVHRVALARSEFACYGCPDDKMTVYVSTDINQMLDNFARSMALGSYPLSVRYEIVPDPVEGDDLPGQRSRVDRPAMVFGMPVKVDASLPKGGVVIRYEVVA